VDITLGVSYFGVRNSEHVEKDLDQMIEAGCNTVLHTFSGNDFLFYRETMQDIVRLSKERGFEVYIDPWGVGGVFGGEAFTRFALEHDDARQVLSTGGLAPAACPNNATFKEFMREWIIAAVEIGADVIFFDEPHFYLPEWHNTPPGVRGCRCATCQRLFRDKYGYPLPEKINLDVQSFKDESLANFIKEMVKFAKGKGVKTALCLLPEWEDTEPATQKWERFASLKTLDIFGSDPYWMCAGKEFADYELQVHRVKELAEKYGEEPQIWIQAYKIKRGEEAKVRRAVEVAYKYGVQNIMAWSYLGTAYMSWGRSEQPEKVWQELARAFLKIRSTSGKLLEDQ
jgi:hypothetical protein